MTINLLRPKWYRDANLWTVIVGDRNFFQEELREAIAWVEALWVEAR